MSSVVAVIAIGGGVYAAWSVSSWQQYEAVAAEQRQQTVARVEAALDMPTDTSEARTKRFEALQAVANSRQAASACEIHGALSWQTAIGSLAEQVERCNDSLESAKQLQNRVETTVAYLENERELAALLNSASQTKPSGAEDDKPTVVEADFAAHRDAWREAASNVSKFETGEAFSETKTAMKARTAALSDAWKTLVAAHEKKDRKAFESARGTLADAYQKLAEAAEQSEEAHERVMSSLEEELAKSKVDA